MSAVGSSGVILALSDNAAGVLGLVVIFGFLALVLIVSMLRP